MSKTNSIGQDLRSLRASRHLTLEQVATHLGRSVGWVSQVERDISAPRMSEIELFADLYGVPISIFFGTADAPDNEQGRIVRAKARRILGERESGLVETLLSPDLTDSFEAIHSTFQPGSARQQAKTRPTQELAYLLSGTLDIWLDAEHFVIQAGDSFRIREQSYRWANPYHEPAIAIWVISPPIY